MEFRECVWASLDKGNITEKVWWVCADGLRLVNKWTPARASSSCGTARRSEMISSSQTLCV